ncbi:MAG: hypothetical protein FWD25_05960 [Clostridia bacterium]|nr:hypothetical protein [Clostridia bacterium]
MLPSENQNAYKSYHKQLIVWIAGLIVALIPLIAISLYAREENVVVWVMSRPDISYICVALAVAACCDWAFRKDKLSGNVIVFDVLFAICCSAFYIVTYIAGLEGKPFEQDMIVAANSFFLIAVLLVHTLAYLMPDLRRGWEKLRLLRRHAA